MPSRVVFLYGMKTVYSWEGTAKYIQNMSASNSDVGHLVSDN